MPHDRKRGLNNRARVQPETQPKRFTSRLSGGIDFNQVSDDDYYRDFAGRNELAESTNLNRKAWLNYHQDLWGAPFNAEL